MLWDTVRMCRGYQVVRDNGVCMMGRKFMECASPLTFYLIIAYSYSLLTSSITMYLLPTAIVNHVMRPIQWSVCIYRHHCMLWWAGTVLSIMMIGVHTNGNGRWWILYEEGRRRAHPYLVVRLQESHSLLLLLIILYSIHQLVKASIAYSPYSLSSNILSPWLPLLLLYS